MIIVVTERILIFENCQVLGSSLPSDPLIRGSILCPINLQKCYDFM